MRHRFKIAAGWLLAVMLLLCAVVPAAALDDKYTFDEFGMSLKLPKSYDVITRNSERGDEVFARLSLDYDDTMTAFNAANIYLQAYDPENTVRITLTVTSDDNSIGINNYSDLTAAQREDILNAYLSDERCTAAVEKKHGGNIYFDISLVTEEDGEPLYIDQCNTVINGLNINLTMQKKGDELFAEESKLLARTADTVSFDRITLKNTGPSFEWWRILLWVLVMVVISAVISLLYRQHTAVKKRQLEQRRQQRAARRAALMREAGEDSADAAQPQPPADPSEPPAPAFEQPTFDQTLGYRSDDEFRERAETDLDTYDINVRDRDPQSGVSYFEDEGDGIDDGTDYFDSYFRENQPPRSSAQRAAGTVGAYLKIAFTHLGYFFKNLAKVISQIFRGNKTKS